MLDKKNLFKLTSFNNYLISLVSIMINNKFFYLIPQQKVFTCETQALYIKQEENQQKHIYFIIQKQEIFLMQLKIIFNIIYLAMQSTNEKSVIIIGAGLAGLTAADQILNKNPNTKITILQAMAESGGRTKCISIKGAIFDLGGQWVGPPQKYVLQLSRRAKIQLINQYHKGTKFLQLGHQIQQYTENFPSQFGYTNILHLKMMMKKIDRLSKTVPLESPRMCPNAIQWDSMTAHTWIQQNIWFDKVKRYIQFGVRTLFGCQTNEVSFLFFLNQNHGFDALMDIQNGLQQKKISKGSQSLSFYLAKQITARGGKIYFSSFVNSVIQNQNGVIVKTRNGLQFKADYLLIAIPPPSVKKISFQPQLSRERRYIIDHYMMGAYSKMIVLYDKPYWRQKGFSGEIISDCYDNPIIFAYDDTRPKENGQIQPALVVFLAANVDQQWSRNVQIWKKSVVEKLASYYKCDQLLNPIAIEMKVWKDEQSLGGAPTAYTPPGVLTKIKDIRQPEGCIHWAGTETALVSTGYMDGAIQSGIRASQQILKRFDNDEPVKEIIPSSKWYSQIFGHRKTKWWDKYLWW